MANVKLGGLSRHNMAMEFEGTWWAVARKNATWNGSTHVENDMGDGGKSRCDWGNHTQDGSVPTGLQIAGSAVAGRLAWTEAIRVTRVLGI